MQDGHEALLGRTVMLRMQAARLHSWLFVHIPSIFLLPDDETTSELSGKIRICKGI